MSDSNTKPWYRRSTMSLGLLFGLVILTLMLLSTGGLAEGPAVNVTSPLESHHTNVATMVVNGTTEANIAVRVLVDGSGGQAWNNSTSQPDGTFEIWVDLQEGYQNVTVQAEDAGGNTTNVTRTVVLDVTKPDLSINPEYLNRTWIPWSEELAAFASTEDEIVINGTASDDSGYLETYGFNGVKKFIFPSGWWPPSIFERVVLAQGYNTINVTVWDMAGNSAEANVTVFCDSLPPPVELEAPAGFSILNYSVIRVVGSTDPNTTVIVRVNANAGSREVTLTSDPDGTFEMEIELFQGFQELSVTVIDELGNRNTTSIDIVSDTVPSIFDILHPPEDPFLTNMTYIEVYIWMRYEDGADVFINGEQVANSGAVKHRVDLVEGENPIEVLSRDHVGNEYRRTVNVVRDTVRPELVVTSDNPYLTSTFSITLEGTVSGASTVRVEYKGRLSYAEVVSAPPDPLEWREELQLEAFDEAPTISIWTVDEAGNRADVTVAVIVDLEGPSISFHNLPEATNLTRVTIRGTTDEDVETVTVNGIPHQVHEGAFSVDVELVEGMNTLVVSVSDRAGNEVYSRISINLDMVVPQLTLTYPKTVDGEVFKLRGTTDDDVVRVWVDDEVHMVENGTFEVEVDLDGDGPHDYLITVEDAAGNRASETIQVEGGEVPGFGVFAALLAVLLAGMKRGRN